MTSNHTTPHISPPDPKPVLPGYSALIAIVMLILIGCMVAVVVHIKRRSRLDELRHRLIPLYTYDPAEEQEWEFSDREDEEDGLAVPLRKEVKLSLVVYGT